MSCTNNLKQFGLALHNYHDTVGKFPYLRSGGGQNRHTWALLLLPYIEQDNTFKTYQATFPGTNKTDGYNNHTSTAPEMVAARTAVVKIFLCPTRHGSSQLSPIQPGSTVMGVPSDYAACVGTSGPSTAVPLTDGVFAQANVNHMTTGVRIGDVTDGTSNTLVLGEKHIQLGKLNDGSQDGVIYSGSEEQTYARRAGELNPLAISNTTTPNKQFGSWHPGICQFVFADGHVQGVKNSTPGPVLGLLANRSDGQVIPEF
jgi:prepilin-type processing-associated H-X9-DG protein